MDRRGIVGAICLLVVAGSGCTPSHNEALLEKGMLGAGIRKSILDEYWGLPDEVMPIEEFETKYGAKEGEWTLKKERREERLEVWIYKPKTRQVGIRGQEVLVPHVAVFIMPGYRWKVKGWRYLDGSPTTSSPAQ